MVARLRQAAIPGRMRVPRQPLLRNGLITLAAGGALYLASSLLSENANFNLAEIAAYAIVIAGLTLLIGGTGQISLGHAALMTVGAYSYAYLEQHQPHLPILAGLLFATAFTAAAGAVIGLAAARLRGPYLAGVTLALGVAVPDLAGHYFNSDQGIPVSLTSPGAYTTRPNHYLALICLSTALVTFFVLANLRRSRLHRSFTAVRDHEIAASLCGISVARTQCLAFVLSAACAGLGGALLSLALFGATPSEFPLTLSIQLLAATVIGGMAGLGGAVAGAVLIVYVPLWVAHVASGSQGNLALNLPSLVFGFLVIGVVMVWRDGIEGRLRWLAGRILAHLPRSRPSN
ncbi:MAG TPA: branched-chain amino acid ABC transporter permease [Streptosporangiaceae bacterium]|nr:branched-chain amino acid ABC transporter permease [Streptosporangiaceae bacterium]